MRGVSGGNAPHVLYNQRLLVLVSGGDAGAFALDFVEDDLADAEVGGGDFEVFVLADVLHGLLEAHLNGGRASALVVGALGAHVGEVLGGDDVDDDVVAGAQALADDLAGIDVVARLDEEGTAVLELADAVGRGLAGLLGDEGTVFVVVHVAFPRLELEEAVGDDSLAVGGGEEGVSQTDDAA